MAARVSDHHRTAFITGASTGLGLAFARMLLADGVRVWGTSRQPARLATLQTGFAGFTPLTLELADGPAAVAAFRAADEASGGFDLVINNAGYGVFAEFAAVDFSIWEEQLRVMLVNTARMTHAAVGLMRARNRGTLVNISSLAAEFPLPFQSAYNMAKAGLSALNESLMVELAGTGVTVIDFRPGDYQTEFDHSVLRPQPNPTPPMNRSWAAFAGMMRTGPAPAGAADALRRALLRRRSGTVRTGRFFQAVVAPLLTRAASLELRRKIQARYFKL